MTTDGTHPSEENFPSNQYLEDRFEERWPFGAEAEPQTRARLNWMLTRHRAVFLVIAHELGIDPVVAAKLSTAQVFLSRDISDFVELGLDIEATEEPPKQRVGH